MDPDFSIRRVEEWAEDEDDDYEVSYAPEPSGKGYICSRVNVTQLGSKVGALRSLAAYAASQGGRFAPFLEGAIRAALPVLNFQFNPSARASAARTLSACYRCSVLAASGEGGGVRVEDVDKMVDAIAKPIGEALYQEEEPEPAEAMLDFLRWGLTRGRGLGRWGRVGDDKRGWL